MQLNSFAGKYCLEVVSKVFLKALLVLLGLFPFWLTAINEVFAQAAPTAVAQKTPDRSASQNLESKDGKCREAARLFSQGAALADGSAAEEELYRAALQLCPHMAEAQYNLGVNLFRQGRNDDAEQALQLALERRDDDSFRVALASVYLQRGDLDAALEHFNRALESNPRSLAALQGISVVRERSGDMDGAVAALESALAIQDTSVVTRFNLAILEERRGNSARSIEHLEHAVKIDPKHYESLLNLGLALERAGRFEESQLALEKAAAIKPLEPGLQRALGVVLARNKDFERAELAMRRALELEDDQPTRLNLALVLLERRQESLARDAAQQAVQALPDDARANLIAGWCDYKLAQYEEAEKLLRRAVDLSPSDAVAHYALSLVLNKRGDSKLAKHHRNAALAINPSIKVDEESLWPFW